MDVIKKREKSVGTAKDVKLPASIHIHFLHGLVELVYRHHLKHRHFPCFRATDLVDLSSVRCLCGLHHGTCQGHNNVASRSLHAHFSIR